MIKIFKLTLITSAVAGLFLQPLQAMEERQTPAGQDSPDVRLSDLPDEIKQNILGKLDNRSLARVKRVDKEWNNQANDPQLKKKNEAYYLRLAFQAGIVTLYSKKDSWADTYANRDNKDWIFSRFKEAIKEFSRDDRLKHRTFITPEDIVYHINSGKTSEKILDAIKEGLSKYNGQVYGVKNIKVGNLSYSSFNGVNKLDALAENKKSQAWQYLKTFKNVEEAVNLDYTEVLTFFATFKVPILTDETQPRSQREDLPAWMTREYLPVDRNDQEVKNAMVVSTYLSVVRQFAKHYERLIKLENRGQQSNDRTTKPPRAN